ncbi:hypothetical protein AVEN_94955-1 [Araneus ventricosus]|uniref:Uncharacterized protein n=1 Tax=Araneus ventricosus TaxID=182803 RepID=A0A4Y2DI60_ARAVE|nr:hypothetical protein AVEN_94955-1 [Araneus ventricosus]
MVALKFIIKRHYGDMEEDRGILRNRRIVDLTVYSTDDLSRLLHVKSAMRQSSVLCGNLDVWCRCRSHYLILVQNWKFCHIPVLR